MTISASFLWRFLDDVWDLLPTQDRQLFETYWTGFVQIGGQLQTKTIEAALSPIIETVPVFLTERWNRFTMDDTTCDLLQKSETLTLSSAAPAPLSVATAFYETFALSTPLGAIYYSEPIEFFDGSVRNLRYGSIVANTVSVKIGPIEYTPGFDYVVNPQAGTIQALEGGRLPIDQVATVTYAHAGYVRGLDYEIDETRAIVVRLPGSTLPDGGAATASYTYNATPTIPLQSSSGVVPAALTSLVDAQQDFSGLLPGRTITVLAGPNAGRYQVKSIISAIEIAVAPSFVVAQVDGGVSYTINAFPHGQRIAKNIVSIPTLQDFVDSPTLVLEEGVDYVVRGGILATRAAIPMMTIGPSDTRTRALWAEKTMVDKETPYRNFGVLINFYRQNSEAYKQALQGLWYTFWTGSTRENLRRGLHILLGLPYAQAAGTVVSLSPPTSSTAGAVQIQDARGQILSYTLPAELQATVATGQAVARFTPLCTGVQVIDRNAEPGFVAARLGRAGIARFLTSKATRGPADTDETKALALLEHHLFIPQVLTEALTSLVNVAELTTFLQNMKPQWTEFVFSFAAETTESVGLNGQGESISAQTTIDATTTINNNESNRIEADGAYLVARATGEIVAGSQATGNFRDLGVDFAALGIGRGDWVRIADGGYHGYFQVLARISSSVVALDLPDASLVPTVGLRYVVLPRELLLGHDSVNLKREHIRRDGTAFSQATALSIKTNANLDGLDNADVAALLLVDAGNPGNEVQGITAARVDLGEISVDAPPTPGVRSHTVTAAAVSRTVRTGGSTEAFAI
jgi:hypothetical protein